MRGDLQEGHFYASRCHLPIFPSTESAFLCALPVAYLLQRRRPRHGRDCCSAGDRGTEEDAAAKKSLRRERHREDERRQHREDARCQHREDAKHRHREAARHHREAARHHREAAEHHREDAKRHHREAGKYLGGEEDEKAADAYVEVDDSFE